MWICNSCKIIFVYVKSDYSIWCSCGLYDGNILIVYKKRLFLLYSCWPYDGNIPFVYVVKIFYIIWLYDSIKDDYVMKWKIIIKKSLYIHLLKFFSQFFSKFSHLIITSLRVSSPLCELKIEFSNWCADTLK